MFANASCSLLDLAISDLTRVSLRITYPSKTEKQKEEKETAKAEQDAQGQVPGAQILQKGEVRCSRDRRTERQSCAPMHCTAPQVTPPVNLKWNMYRSTLNQANKQVCLLSRSGREEGSHRYWHFSQQDSFPSAASDNKKNWHRHIQLHLNSTPRASAGWPASRSLFPSSMLHLKLCSVKATINFVWQMKNTKLSIAQIHKKLTTWAQTSSSQNSRKQHCPPGSGKPTFLKPSSFVNHLSWFWPLIFRSYCLQPHNNVSLSSIP